MRKLTIALLCLILTTGLALAAPVILLSFDGKQITIKDGDKESTYKITDKTTYVLSTGGGEKTVAKDSAVKMLKDDKSKGKKIEVVLDGENVSQVRLPGKKPKQ